VNADTTPQLLAYIDKVIQTNIPDKDSDPELFQLVTSLQTHRHTKYCTPQPRAKCRFKFPHLPCAKTRIFSHSDVIRNKGKYYEPARNNNASFINPYNAILLRHFRSNMDIQVVNNAESVAY
jgi:hypothetical protein